MQDGLVSMKKTAICLAFVLAAASAHAAPSASNHRVALLSHITCPAIREAVKLYGEAAAEQWARGHGVSETRIEQAKRCLK
jgi:hypothetical protein